MGPATHPTILHLSIDYNDPHRERTTTAIEWFVDELGDFDNVVISMTRRANPWRTYFIDCGKIGRPRVFAFGYFGLPFGVGLFFSMWLAARRIRRGLDRAGIRPDLIHAHKLGFEGIAGWLLARRYRVPFFVSLRGEVETKIFRRKPTYRLLLRRIVRDAARVYHVSAWFRDEFHRHVAPLPTERLLPNIVRNVRPTITPAPPGERFVTIMDLNIWRRKGLDILLDAFRLAEMATSRGLDVIGGGSAGAQAEAADLRRKAGLEQRVAFLGRVSNEELLRRLPGYRALLLPSFNETFGMVYVEALFAGVPILYTRGTGIDGYLAGVDVGVSAPAGDRPAVAAAIRRLDVEADGFRTRLAAAGPELFKRFDPEQIVARYQADVREVLQMRSERQPRPPAGQSERSAPAAGLRRAGS